MSGLFKSKSKEPEIQKIYDPFEGVRGSLSSWLQDTIGKPAPAYTGEFVAPETDTEKASQQKLTDFAGDSSYKQDYALSRDEYKKTLEGDYDPSTSPYYQAVKAVALRNQDKAIDTAKQHSAMGRRFFGGGRARQVGDIVTDTTNQLNVTLGGLAEKERQNKLTAAGLLPQLSDKERAQDLGTIDSMQKYGALPRLLNQAKLDAIYNEYLSSTREYPLNVAQIAGGLGAKEPIFTSTSAPKQKTNPLSFLTTLFNIF